MHWTNAIIVAVAAISAPDFRVEMLDGPPAEGTLSAITDNAVVLSSDKGETSVATEDLLRVVLSGRERTAVAAPWIEFRDGSLIPVQSLSVNRKSVTLQIEGSDHSVVVHVASVAAIRLQSPTPEIELQWKEIRAAEIPSDLLVVRRKNSVDYISGIVGDLSDSEIAFSMDGEQLSVSRSKVDGVIFFRRQENASPAPRMILVSADGMRIAAKHLDLHDDRIVVHAGMGFQLTVPLEDVAEIDYSAGKFRYLSDLAPIERAAEPLVALPEAAEIAREAEGPFFDRGFFANKLSILKATRQRGRIKWAPWQSERGIAIRGGGRLTYLLPKGFRRFRAIAGIDGHLEGRGSVELAISGDGKTIFRCAVAGDQEPVDVNVDISDVRRLMVLVGFGDGGDVGDRLNLCEARITK